MVNERKEQGMGSLAVDMKNERIAELEAEVTFLSDENEKLARQLKTRTNKVRHLQQQLSDSRLRKRIAALQENAGQMGLVIQRLKREKDALHDHVEAAIAKGFAETGQE